MAAAFLIATLAVGIDRNDRGPFPGVILVALGVVCAGGAVVFTRTERASLAFAASAATVALGVVMLFAMLYPRVMVASNDFGNSLTIENASSGAYTLEVMTVVVALLLPVVVLYQAWSYRVFRERLGAADPIGSPAELLGPKRSAPSDEH